MFCSRSLKQYQGKELWHVRDAAFSQTDLFLEFTSLFTKRFSSRPQKPPMNLGKVPATLQKKTVVIQQYQLDRPSDLRTKSNLEHKSSKI